MLQKAVAWMAAEVVKPPHDRTAVASYFFPSSGFSMPPTTPVYLDLLQTYIAWLEHFRQYGHYWKPLVAMSILMHALECSPFPCTQPWKCSAKKIWQFMVKKAPAHLLLPVPIFWSPFPGKSQSLFVLSLICEMQGEMILNSLSLPLWLRNPVFDFALPRKGYNLQFFIFRTFCFLAPSFPGKMNAFNNVWVSSNDVTNNIAAKQTSYENLKSKMMMYININVPIKSKYHCMFIDKVPQKRPSLVYW